MECELKMDPVAALQWNIGADSRVKILSDLGFPMEAANVTNLLTPVKTHRICVSLQNYLWQKVHK